MFGRILSYVKNIFTKLIDGLPFVLLIGLAVGIATCVLRKDIDKSGHERVGELSAEYRREYERAGELVGGIIGEIGEVRGKVGSVRDSLVVNANNIQSIGEAILKAADEIEDLENYLDDIVTGLSRYLDEYYNSFDAEIERELGIRVPK